MNAAVFLDRDGTLNHERHYLANPDDLELFPETIPALLRLQEAGFLLFLVTNQSGIGRGLFTEQDMHRVHARLHELLAASGVQIRRVYYAPEAPDQPSRGRKPSPQFLFDARDEFGLDLGSSFMIGDKSIDLETGWNAGVRASILVRTGYGSQVEREAAHRIKDCPVADHLGAAADWILSQSRPRLLGILPARYGSTRFPGKPLALIAGKPLIQHVVERCRMSQRLAEVIVATDDPRILTAVEPFCRVEMTHSEHPSGTDRIAEVAARCDCDGVINIQGDEPLMEPAVIDAVADALRGAPMATAATPLTDPSDLDNPNVVKLVTDQRGRALYFSRRTIPYLRDLGSGSCAEQAAAFRFLKHLGIYGYRREILLKLVGWPVSKLEAAERLEQLRALEHGVPIAVVSVNHESVGVDTPADVGRVEAVLRRMQALPFLQPNPPV